MQNETNQQQQCHSEGFRPKNLVKGPSDSLRTTEHPVILSAEKNLSIGPSRSFRTTAMMALTVALGLTLSVQAQAKCEGGTEISGKSGTFCKSNKTMTWWSAILWCEAQGGGMHLAKWSEACPGNSTADGTCDNLNGVGSGTIWTAQPSGANSAYYVDLPNGNVSHYFGRNNFNYALCNEL